ncbi:hypothetical protein ACIRST_29305 [Kitasatospora sp. NPDC101447]
MALTMIAPPIPPITPEDRTRAAASADRVLTVQVGKRGGDR